MTSMSRLFVAALLALSACSSPAVVTTTTTDPVTTAPPQTVTTVPTVDVEIQDCDSPPVTFSPFCEMYELLETWYVDAPVDAGSLAGLAVEGLADFEPTEFEEPPRTLFCAIPHQEFSRLCDALADRVATSQVPVGPAVEHAISYMIDNGLDPFTYYLPPGQTGSVRLNGIVGGIGVVLDARDAVGSKCTRITDVCRLEVIVVLEDNPGSTAGLQKGDIITRVDGESVEDKGFTSVVSEIAGDETGTVELTVERADAEMSFSIERTELVTPTVEYGIPVGGVGYIRIPDFELDIPQLVHASLDEIAAEAPGTLVVDLRDNPGGYIDSVVEVADDFIDNGVVMVSEAPTEHLEYEAEPGGPATGQRLVVLVNEGTASAAEVLAGALRDRRSAVVLGTNTFGKNAVQIAFTLRNGGEFHLAVARWTTPDGETAGDGGLIPDREVAWPAGSTVEEIVEMAMEAAQ